MRQLDSRKGTILRAVIVEYVSAAEPVGSELLAQKYDLGVKSATIRNELADLSDLGFLEQPHTSAGRIPSDQGYRYYVDNLIVNRDLGQSEKHKVKGASEDGDALQTLLRDTTKALSRLTHLLTAATVVRDANVSVRTAVVSALGPTQALLVLVLSNGHVENRMIECPPGLTLQDIGTANEALNSTATGKTLRWLTRNKQPALAGNPSLEKFVGVLWNSIRNIAKDLTRGKITTEGEEFLFAQPEFHRDALAFSELLEELKESDVLMDALSAPTDQPQAVTIGRENRHEKLHQLSVIRQAFFVGENEAGAIALIGPTRMRYETGIPLVNYTAKALSDSLTKFFG